MVGMTNQNKASVVGARSMLCVYIHMCILDDFIGSLGP